MFKQLTQDNWQQPDPTNELFAQFDRQAGRVRRMTPDDWAGYFLAVELDERVPADVRDLFAVARGTMLYGAFFYPLYTVGSEQARRVADAAALHRYNQLGGPKTKNGNDPSFRQRIKWLVDQGALAKADEPRWDAQRELRNIGSHPDFQMLHMPGDVLHSLRVIAASVNELFASEAE
jgi:hypothetical protein